jgi:hypothetical protein
MFTRFAIAVFTGFVLIIPMQVMGSDAKQVSPATCIAADGRDQWRLDYTESGVKNSTSAYTHVFCAIPRDNAWNTSGTKSVLAYLYDGSYSYNFWCAFNTCYSSGNYCSWSSGSTYGIGYRTLNLDLSWSRPSGAYTLECWVPPYSQIRSVFLNEW